MPDPSREEVIEDVTEETDLDREVIDETIDQLIEERGYLSERHRNISSNTGNLPDEILL